MSSQTPATQSPAPKVTCKFISIKDISINALLEMHQVFVQYYHNADLETFIHDMSKKSGAFVLRDERENRIVGFSTFVEMHFVFKGRKAVGVFSGDTVLEKAYWGNKALQYAFAVKLFKTKMKNPTKQVFWLLISKGYKTYLLLTNNFPRHYPAYRSKNPELSEVVDMYCRELYPEYYDAEKQILDFGDSYQCLKDDVADITSEMRLQNPNIRFFDDKNSGWRQGNELPCVGEADFLSFGLYLKKIVLGDKPKKAPTPTPIAATVMRNGEGASTQKVAKSQNRVQPREALIRAGEELA